LEKNEVKKILIFFFRVGIFGCGSKGNEVLKQFYLLGVGKDQEEGMIYLIDNSKIKPSNLSTQFMFK